MVWAVMLPRERWTDKRLDERFDRIDERFDAVDKRLDLLDKDMREMKQAMNQLQRTVTTGFVGIAGLIASAVVFFQ
jgi:hypothetical protein